jgi:tetratricopeptide (TPR) repeat protein
MLRYILLLILIFSLRRGTVSSAAAPAELDKLVEVARLGCLVGTQYDLEIDKKVGDLVFSDNSGGTTRSTKVEIRTSLGATQIIDDELRVKGDDKTRGCMKPYIDSIFAAIVGPLPSVGQLEIVDVSFARYDFHKFPILDVKLRNTGEVAALKEAIFDVKHGWELKTGVQPGNMCISWNYDVLLPILGKPNPVRVKLAQTVKKDDTDRFTFTLGNDAPPGLSQYAFLIDVTLIYNADNSIVKLPPLFVVADSAKLNVGQNNGGDFAAAFRNNVKVFQELGDFRGLTNEKARDYYNLFSNYALLKRINEDEKIITTSILQFRRLNAVKDLGFMGKSAEPSLKMLRGLAVGAGVDKDPYVQGEALLASEKIWEELKAGSDHGLSPMKPLQIEVEPEEILHPEMFCLGTAAARLDAGNPDAPPETSPKPVSADDFDSRADKEFDNKQYIEAVLDATAAIKLGNKHARSRRGQAYLSLQRYKEAEQDFSWLIARGDTDPWVRVNRALAYLKLGNVKAANVDFGAALKEHKLSDAEIYIKRAGFRLSIKDYNGAVGDIRKAIAMAPEKVSSYALLGEALLINGKYAEAGVVARQIEELAQSGENMNDESDN